MSLVENQQHSVDQNVTLAWKLNIDHDDMLKWVQRKLSKARNVETSLYYHPMLGCEFDWYGTTGKLIKINILVDLVSGRGFAAAPWHEQTLGLPEKVLQDQNDHAVSSPEVCIDMATARQTARSIAQVLVTRKRRFGGVGVLSAETRDVPFLKPNWWVTGEHRGRELELILDGVTGKHYIFSG